MGRDAASSPPSASANCLASSIFFCSLIPRPTETMISAWVHDWHIRSRSLAATTTPNQYQRQTMNELQRMPETAMPQVIDVTPRTTSIDTSGPGLKRDYAGLLEYWQMVRRHKGAVILATFFGALGGFLLTLVRTRASTRRRLTLEIQGLNEEFLNMKNVNPVSRQEPTAISTPTFRRRSRSCRAARLLTRVRDKLDATATARTTCSRPDRLGVWRKALKINPPTQEQLVAPGARHRPPAASGSRASGTNRIVDVVVRFDDRPAGRRFLQHADAGVHRPEPRGAVEDHGIHRPVAHQAAAGPEDQAGKAGGGAPGVRPRDASCSRRGCGVDDTRQERRRETATSCRSCRRSCRRRRPTASRSSRSTRWRSRARPSALPDVLDDAALKDSQTDARRSAGQARAAQRDVHAAAMPR